MNITIQDEVHASTNPHKSVCGLSIPKKRRFTETKITCPICQEREEKRFREIQAYIQRLLNNESLPVDQKMWRLVGYVEGGLI